MDDIIEFAKILIPAGLVLYAMFLTVRTFLNKEIDKKTLEIKHKNTETVLPIRLQAYERMCLFLERINPTNLLVRLNDSSYTTADLHNVLLKEIREEYNHNMSQQLYMSDEVWQLIKGAMDEIIALINDSFGKVNVDDRGTQLAKEVFATLMDRSIDPVSFPLKRLKEEIRDVF